jgi:hypothetical protein
MATLMVNVIAYQETKFSSDSRESIFSVAYVSKSGLLKQASFRNVYGAVDMLYCSRCEKVEDIETFIKEYNAPIESRLKKVQLLKEFGHYQSETKAIGGGEWAIEVYGWNDDEERREFLFELVGSNGTRDNEEPDDLHGYLSELYDEAFPPEERESVVDRG